MPTLKQATIAVFAFSIAFDALAQRSDPLSAELASIEQQISEVEDQLERYDGGLIRGLAEARREALLLSRTVIENRIRAERGDAEIEVVVPATEPDDARAAELLGEIEHAKQRIKKSERESTERGGLIQALAISRLETEKLTLAQLQMAYLQAKYGIAFPAVSAPSPSPSPAVQESPSAASAGDGTEGTSPWADPRFPQIDYSLQPFEEAHRDGKRISGWWTIESDRAAVDDSPKITTVNYSAYDPGNWIGFKALIARCVEGETAVIFIQDDYLLTDFRRNSFDVTLRIDDEHAQQARWSSLTNNKGAGLFREEAEAFVRKIYDSQRLFVRLVEKNGEQHEALFDLAGGKDAYEEVAAACGWTTLPLSPDDYRAIQTLLNAGGFEAGAPDGQWGPASRNAMREFQASVDLPQTGAPDRATLNRLGFSQ